MGTAGIHFYNVQQQQAGSRSHHLESDMSNSTQEAFLEYQSDKEKIGFPSSPPFPIIEEHHHQQQEQLLASISQ